MTWKFYPLSANITKWPNTLKQFVGKLPTNCLNVFDHFVGLALKELINVHYFASLFHYLWCIYTKIEAVSRRCSVKKMILKISQKFTGKHLCQRLLFNKGAEACNLIKKESLVQVFSCKFCKISKNNLFYRTQPVPASVIVVLKKGTQKYTSRFSVFSGTHFIS